LKEYASARDLAEALEKHIAATKSVLGEYLRRLDEVRAVAEKSKKIRDVIVKLAGKKGVMEGFGEITIGNLRISLDANPFHELAAIEEVVRSYQERLIMLQKARESLKWLDQLGDAEGLKYVVVENDGVPERILLKIT
jgi:hypothetical protein